MRTLWNFVSFLAVVNLLALLIAAGWLWQSGRLSRERVADIRSVLSSTEHEARAAAARSVSEIEQARLREFEAQMRLHPPADSATQISQVSFVQQQSELARRRLDDERRMLAQQLQDATARMESDISAFEREASTFNRARQDQRQRKIDEQFLQAVRQLEQLPPKQAKRMLETLASEKNIAQAVAYLDAMSPRAAAKVLREFKTDAEVALATELLERLRTFGVPAPDGSAAAPSSAADAFTASNTAAANAGGAAP